MSLKSIDLQIAISRTSEVSQQQQHTSHKPLDDQAALALSGQKNAEDRMNRSGKAEESAKSLIRDSRGRQSGGQGNPRQDRQDREDEPDARHPYLGHHLDLKT